MAEDSNKYSIDAQKAVSLFGLLKEKRYFSFTKELLKSIYRIYKVTLKGKHIKVAGKNIPLTLVLVVALFVAYLCVPQNAPKPQPEENKPSIVEKQLPNTYEKDGIRVYDFKRCERGVCGLLENTTQETIARIIISLNFTDKSGNVLSEGGADPENIEPMTRSHIIIPTDIDFDKFVLTDVTVVK